jgi:hypothetical protein
MSDWINPRTERDHDMQTAGGWHVVVSAWVLVLLFSLLLAAAGAMACQRSQPAPHRHLAGAVIPQHDPCAGSGIPSAPSVDGCKRAPITPDWSAAW